MCIDTQVHKNVCRIKALHAYFWGYAPWKICGWGVLLCEHLTAPSHNLPVWCQKNKNFYEGIIFGVFFSINHSLLEMVILQVTLYALKSLQSVCSGVPPVSTLLTPLLLCFWDHNWDALISVFYFHSLSQNIIYYLYGTNTALDMGEQRWLGN